MVVQVRKNILLADSIRLAFGSREVLNGAWLRAETGKVTGLLGRNGCGKSCMFRAIMGDLAPQDLFVKVNELPVAGYREIGLYVKYLPQRPFLPPQMKLEEVFLWFGLDFSGLVAVFPNFSKYEYERVGNLSGGEKRIVEIWLCLYSGAPFCILDEPFAYLSPVYVEKVQKMIDEQKQHVGIIISDHNYEAILEISDEILLLSQGYVHLVRDREDLVRLGYCRSV